MFRLASALPDAEVLGIDISAANVRAAAEQQAARPEARVRFVMADYLTFTADPFDAIVTDGVLHLIPGDTATLVRKLAQDVRPGGLVICCMPFDCTYNRLMTMLRRVLARLRSAWLDDLILRIARLLHGAEMDDASLRERVRLHVSRRPSGSWTRR